MTRDKSKALPARPVVDLDGRPVTLDSIRNAIAEIDGRRSPYGSPAMRSCRWCGSPGLTDDSLVPPLVT